MTSYQNAAAATSLKSQTSLQQNHQAALQVEVTQGYEYGFDLYETLNGLRASFKKKRLNKDMIGELAVNELMHMNVLGQQDIRFQSTMDKY